MKNWAALFYVIFICDRLYPPTAPGSFVRLEKDTVISGYEIPAGVRIGINYYFTLYRFRL